jgi:hypothetical protein
VLWRQNKHLPFRAAVFAATLAAGATLATPKLARAQGIFDFLFGGSQQHWAPPGDTNSHVEPPPPIGRLAPPPMGPESVRQDSGDTGRAVGYCVRLCDGQHFPMEHLANASPVETCRAMCPASKTKVFFGSAIDHAVASDGARYTDLDTAFVYRKQLVANCTCNGKDAFGLARFDASADPTLRPGDIVSTKDGYVAYSGKPGQTGAFTPVDSSAVAAELVPAARAAPRSKPSRSAEPAPAPAEAEDDPGTIVRPGQPSPPLLDPSTSGR